jgi:hypothetical protein
MPPVCEGSLIMYSPMSKLDSLAKSQKFTYPMQWNEYHQALEIRQVPIIIGLSRGWRPGIDP